MDTHRIDEPIVSRFFKHLRALGKSHNTVLAYRTALRDLAHTAERPLLGLIVDDLNNWLADAADRVDPATVRSYLTGIRAFYVWATLQELIPTNPAERLELPRAPRRLPRPIADNLIDLALDGAEPDVAAAIGLERYAGLRCCEVAGLDRTEVTLGEDAHLRVVKGKGCHERVVDIAPRLEALLRALPGPWSGPVIPRRDGRRGHVAPWRISQLINERLDECGIDGTAHQLRHAFGTALYTVSKDIRATGEAMGHVSPSTTALYARVTRTAVRQAVLDAAELKLT